MRDFDVRQRLREGWKLESDGNPYLLSPAGQREYHRNLHLNISRMVREPHPLMREVDAGFHLRRWELC